MDLSSWSEVARKALTQYHLGNLPFCVQTADAAQDDRHAMLVGALASYESFDLRSTYARCEKALEHEPQDAIDRRMSLLARWADAVLSGDPTALQTDIDEALKCGDTWIQAAAYEHQLDIVALHNVWQTEVRYAPSWANAQEFASRAAEAYEHADDRLSVLRMWARIASQAMGPEAWEIVERLAVFAKEADAAQDLVALARCTSITAVLYVNAWIASGGKDEPPRDVIVAAFELAKLVSAPSYAADVYVAMGANEPQYFLDATRAYGDCGQIRGAFEAMLAYGKISESMNRPDAAAQAFAIARETADLMHFALARVWSRLYLAQALFDLGRHVEAFWFAEEALDLKVHESAQAMLLLRAGTFAGAMHDAPRSIRFFTSAVSLLEHEAASQRALSLALRGAAAGYRELHNRWGFAKGIEALERACEIDRAIGDRAQEAEKLPELVLLYVRTATHCVKSKETVPQQVRDGATRAIERFRAVAAETSPDDDLRMSLLIAEAMFEYRFGSPTETFCKLDAARAIAHNDSDRAKVDEWAGAFGIEYGVETRDVEVLRRANEHIEEAYRAAEQSTVTDALRGPAQDSARVNALLSQLETDSALRAAAARKARERVRLAVEIYERANYLHRGGDPASDMESQFGLHRLASVVYMLAVQVHVLNCDYSDAFEAIERLKSLVLAGALAFTELRPPEGVDAEALGNERHLLQIWTSDPDPARRGSAREQLESTWDRMRDRPGGETYVSLRRGETIPWHNASRLLAEADDDLGAERQLVIVEYCVTGEYPLTDTPLFAFILRGGDVQPLIVPIPISLAEIGEVVISLHKDSDELRWPELLARLTPLVAPIAEHARPNDVVCIVPSERLYLIPVHAIPVDGGGPLILRNPVFYAPSVTALRMTIRERRSGTPPGSSSVFGNPTEDLTFAEHEARAVGKHLGVTPHIGRDATAAAFVEALRSSDTVHFAGHGYFSVEQPLRSGIVLANNTIINAEQLLKLRDARADLVVLSGCSTGMNVTSTGDEIVGLTRAFLYSGVSTLVQSLWPVEDKATARLMTEFYTNWQKHAMSRVDALRSAMLTLREISDQPFLWAPFTLFGDWR